jgi:hypothetical protein
LIIHHGSECGNVFIVFSTIKIVLKLIQFTGSLQDRRALDNGSIVQELSNLLGILGFEMSLLKTNVYLCVCYSFYT